MKIEANSLRVGNYLEDHNNYMDKSKIGKIVIVDDICWNGINATSDYYGISADIRFENLKGIELTPEILEKAGFEKTEVDMGNEKQEGFYKKGLIILKHEDIYYAAPYGYPMGGDCNYLHQLQNLYFILVGKELEISL